MLRTGRAKGTPPSAEHHSATRLARAAWLARHQRAIGVGPGRSFAGGRFIKPAIAIMSPGDMGHAVGAVLRQGGLRVITQLDGRRERTRALAARAGIEQAADNAALVRAADVLL
jgi:non-ribosomal peptide synthetase component F